MEDLVTKRPLGATFWALCGGGLASNIGDGAVLVGFPILTATLTRDPRVLAGVTVAQRLPWLLLSLVTGALADRLDKRRLIGCVEALRMAAVGALGFAVIGHFHPLAAIFLAAFCLGSCETAFSGASGAILPQLVDRLNLGRANGYLYASQISGEGLIGPAAGGLLAAAALSLPFLLDSATFALSGAVLLVALPRRSDSKKGPRTQAPESCHRALPSVRNDVTEALRWFRANPAIKSVAAFIAGLAFCQAAVISVLILWAERYLHVSRAGYGLLQAVTTAGVIGAAVITGRWSIRFRPANLLVVAGLTAGICYIALATTASIFVAAIVLTAEGAAVSVGNIVSLTLRQTLIPGELLGRVGNAMRTCIFGAVPAGALTGGLLAHALGLRSMFLLAGLVQVTGVGVARAHLNRVLEPTTRLINVASPVEISLEDDATEGPYEAIGTISPDSALQLAGQFAENDPHGEVLLAG